MKIPDTKRLYNGCMKNDDQLRAEFFRVYLPYIKGICRRYEPDNEDIKDMIQEIFIKIFSKINSHKWKSDDAFNSWVRVVATNYSIDFVNNKIKNKQFFEAQESDITDEIAEEHEEADMLEFSHERMLEALGQLPEHYRLVFNLCAVEGLSHKDCAVKLGISLKTSTTRLVRARRQILSFLHKTELVKQ